MANASETVGTGNAEPNITPWRLFPGGPFLCISPSQCGDERRTDSHPARRSPPHYLNLPALETIQETITEFKDTESPCRILAGLNSIFSPDGLDLFKNNSDPFLLASQALQIWLESFLSSRVVGRIDMSLQVLSPKDVDYNLASGLPQGDTVIQVSLEDYENGFFPLGDTLNNYENQYPGLAKYILRMLSVCPFQIGTPENIYELASFHCWNGNDNEEETFDDIYQEYIFSGESEEDSRETAQKQILVEYAEFEKYLPEWTFKRSERICDYHGLIPTELQHLQRCFHRWTKIRKTHAVSPQYTYPGVTAPLDQNAYDFCCNVINDIGYMQCEYESNYDLPALLWSFPIKNSRKMLTVFREIRSALEYFGACLDFLYSHEKEYLND